MGAAARPSVGVAVGVVLGHTARQPHQGGAGLGTLDGVERFDQFGDPGAGQPRQLRAFQTAGRSPVLADQIAEFGLGAEYVMDALAANLADPWYRAEVIRVGIQRLVEGYEEFGDAMYKWDVNRRDEEMFEEIADAVVYGTSGRFFDVRFT
jgi:hypothetical protein